MPKKEYDLAYIKVQGQNMIIIPVDQNFEMLSESRQREEENSFQRGAHEAGLKGNVCLVWQSGAGLRFRAPRAWHDYFSRITWDFIAANINRSLTFNEP